MNYLKNIVAIVVIYFLSFRK